MRAWKFIASAALIAVLSVLLLGCEDSDVTAPSGSTITLVASPANIFIDQDLGDSFGQTTLIAQIVDESGEPVNAVPVFFTTTSGFLNSVNNACLVGSCTRTGDACVSDLQCPVLPPEPVLTNTSGIAVDVLTLRLIEDADVAGVTVQTTSLSAQTTVDKVVNLGPIDPVPIIIAQPGLGQRTGFVVTFNGSGSQVDPLVDPECYEWTIDSNINSSDELVRTTTMSVINRTYGTTNDPFSEQDLAITLRVSDEDTFLCSTGVTPPDGVFGPNVATLSYSIRCDLTPPIVEAGPDQTRSLSDQSPAVVTLTATASDPESPSDLTYVWACGNGQGGNQETVTCSYTSVGTFTATVTVQNACGLVTQDSLVVTINA